MKNRYKFIGLLLLFVGILSFGLNLNDFIMGQNPHIVFCISSILFIVCYIYFCFINGSKRCNLALIIYSASLSLVGLITFVIGTFDLSFDILIPFSIVALTPYYGLSLLIGADICALIICIFAAVLCAASLIIRKSKTRFVLS